MDFDEILGPEDVTTSVYTCKVKDRLTITSEGDKKVIEIYMEIGRPVFKDRLDVGQSIAITPQNSSNDVDMLI